MFTRFSEVSSADGAGGGSSAMAVGDRHEAVVGTEQHGQVLSAGLPLKKSLSGSHR
jgi:hypothetical protein